jgi:hypothetical protein
MFQRFAGCGLDLQFEGQRWAKVAQLFLQGQFKFTLHALHEAICTQHETLRLLCLFVPQVCQNPNELEHATLSVFEVQDPIFDPCVSFKLVCHAHCSHTRETINADKLHASVSSDHCQKSATGCPYNLTDRGIK